MQISTTLPESAPVPGSTCVALGMFDGIHRGHRAVLDAMCVKSAAGALAPCVFTFSIVQSRPESKQDIRLLMSEEQMNDALADLGVTALYRPAFEAFRGLSPEEFVREVLHRRLGAACVVCGQNFHFGYRAAGDSQRLGELCAALGMEAVIVPPVLEGELAISSTRIRAAIAQGDIPAANRMLGRPFALDFAVIQGRKLGRTLNWPTINQPFPAGFAVPRYGVYATRTWVENRWHSSVTNVGVKPTVGSDDILSETYIQGFSGDLYGQKIPVEFLAFMRPEQKFGSVEELRAQIAADAARAGALTGKSL